MCVRAKKHGKARFGEFWSNFLGVGGRANVCGSVLGARDWLILGMHFYPDTIEGNGSENVTVA